jgi:hypothetical protein
MRYQNHIRGQEIFDGKLEGNVAVIIGVLSEGKLEKEGR